MPFDWLLCPSETLLQILRTDFMDLLDPEMLVADPSGLSSRHLKYNDIRFPHHNLALPEVHQAFIRRVERFRDTLKSKRRILFFISQSELAVVREIAEYLPDTSYCLSLWLQESAWMQTPFISTPERILHVTIPAFTCGSILPP